MKILYTLHQKTDNGFSINSPAVGYAAQLPASNALVSAHTAVGTMQILGTTFELRLPQKLQGKVVNRYDAYLVRPLAYGEEIFTVVPIANEQTDTKADQDLAGDRKLCAINAPTDGIFYRRSSPDAAPYVKIGDTIKSGQVLGLVEVMKCFNQIKFSGSQLPGQAKIAEICVEDGAEVKYQQPLFVLAEN